MKSNFTPVVLFVAALLVALPLAKAEEPDADVSKILKDAEEQAKKMNLKVPDLKTQMSEIEADEAKEKAALKKQLEAPGPIVLPSWTPVLPQFTAAGPATRKIIDDQVHIVVTGTSPLTPAELGDAWEAAKKEGTSFGRSNNSINDTKTVYITLRPQETALGEVRLEATRAPKEKITHVTISSPLPKPEVD
jgi:hypothetical protein